MSQRDELREATSRGAKLLDKLVPGWANRVKLETLDMADIHLCMLGQLFGSDVETALAKEMYPEELKRITREHGVSAGYSVGKKFVLGKAGVLAPPGRHEATGPADVETAFLLTACSGYATKCYWAEEVADRVTGEKA